MRPCCTRELIHAAATDAGNRSMRAAGRRVWSAVDYAVACAEYDRLAPCGEPDLEETVWTKGKGA